jgi:multidrug transporter EmrE-like cation transporter
MQYVFLAAAIVFEVGWVVAMKVSAGLTRPGPTVCALVMYVLSLVFLARAARSLDISVAYALWAGTGAAVIALIGVLWFKDAMTPVRGVSLGLIVAGIVGLNLSGATH